MIKKIQIPEKDYNMKKSTISGKLGILTFYQQRKKGKKANRWPTIFEPAQILAVHNTYK